MINVHGDESERTKLSVYVSTPLAKAITLTLIVIIMREGEISGDGDSNGLIALQLAGVEIQAFLMIFLHHGHISIISLLPALTEALC